MRLLAASLLNLCRPGFCVMSMQVQRDLAEARMGLEQARLLVLHAAWKMDIHGGARGAQQVTILKQIVD